MRGLILALGLGLLAVPGLEAHGFSIRIGGFGGGGRHGSFGYGGFGWGGSRHRGFGYGRHRGYPRYRSRGFHGGVYFGSPFGSRRRSRYNRRRYDHPRHHCHAHCGCGGYRAPGGYVDTYYPKSRTGYPAPSMPPQAVYPPEVSVDETVPTGKRTLKVVDVQELMRRRGR